MKVKLETKGEIEINLKRKHTKKIMNLYSDLSSDGADTGDALKNYTSELDKIACEVIDMSEEEFDELDSNDANIILNKIQEVSLGQLDFVKSSLK